MLSSGETSDACRIADTRKPVWTHGAITRHTPNEQKKGLRLGKCLIPDLLIIF